jgi:predicted Ser/Thr protein kinase
MVDGTDSHEDTATIGDSSRAPTFESRSAPLVRPVAEATRIGRYQILRELGSGGMGIVYAAYDESLDRRVALKLLLRKSAATEQRLRREAQAMARISHTNVAQIFEVGEHQGQLFVAMEYVEGKNLAHWLDQESLGWSEIIDVFIRAGRGLQAAHEAGVVHRDFKPDNVMIQRADELCVKVVDFGIAAVELDDLTIEDDPASEDDIFARLTRTGALMGTPHYMSPEHFRGHASDPRSDQFGFALALYEALYRQRPFDGDTFAELREQVLAGRLRPPPRITDVPAWAFETLQRALAVNPDERFSSMAELLHVLAHHPDRTADPDHDRTVALGQRLWMLSVLTLGTFGLLAVLLLVRSYTSLAGFEEYAFWSKLMFTSTTVVALVATKHVFMRNTYNRRVFAMVMAMAVAAMAISICARVMELSAAQTDRFLIVMLAAVFGQASASVGGWLIAIPVLALAGLVVSFVFPFAASVTLGLCFACGTGMTVYFWTRRSRLPVHTTRGASGAWQRVPNADG